MTGAVIIPLSPADGWRAEAFRLAVHAWDRMVNRVDVWGQYVTKGALTMPAKVDRGRVLLDTKIIERHFLGRSRYDVIGLHTTSGAHDSLWGALDIDAHEKSPEIAERNLETARQALVAFRARGLEPLLEDSNGAGGFHVWTFFERPVPAQDLHALLLGVIAELGLDTEVFPKQPRISEYGNWLRAHFKTHLSRLLKLS